MSRIRGFSGLLHIAFIKTMLISGSNLGIMKLDWWLVREQYHMRNTEEFYSLEKTPPIRDMVIAFKLLKSCNLEKEQSYSVIWNSVEKNGQGPKWQEGWLKPLLYMEDPLNTWIHVNIEWDAS